MEETYQMYKLASFIIGGTLILFLMLVFIYALKYFELRLSKKEIESDLIIPPLPKPAMPAGKEEKVSHSLSKDEKRAIVLAMIHEKFPEFTNVTLFPYPSKEKYAEKVAECNILPMYYHRFNPSKHGNDAIGHSLAENHFNIAWYYEQSTQETTVWRMVPTHKK